MTPEDTRAPDPEVSPENARLYSAVYAELVRYVRAQFGAGPPDPEDAAHAAFERYFRAAETQLVRNPRAFLYASVRNFVIDHRRRQRTRDRHAKAVGASEEKNFDGISPERVLIEKERFEIMRQAIQSMPTADRRVLLMNRLRGLTYAEIARRTGMSESAVRRAVARAIAHIDGALRAKGAGQDL